MKAFLYERALLWLAFAACAAALSLYAYTYFRPSLMQDDFAILAQSLTWERTWANLWVPNNEHAMPLGRLLTFVVVLLAGSPRYYPLVAALIGPAALLVGMLLTYRFVRRELGHPFYGLVAMSLFGVTAVYQQAVFWFAASFSVLTLDTLLLGLLAAQSYRLTRWWPHLLLCAMWCGVAPCWFASGVLAGPLCGVYLLCSTETRVNRTQARRASEGMFPRWRVGLVSIQHALSIQVALATIPSLGTALFLAVSLPRTAAAIVHLPHYKMQDTDAIGAFQPGKGFLMSLRSLVENLLLGVFGITEVTVPVPLVIVALLGLGIAGVWWWRRAPDRRLLLLGIALIGMNYILVYSARARWTDSTSLVGVAWCRYHLLPQLGLAMFVTGGLPAWNGRRFLLQEDGRLRAFGTNAPLWHGLLTVPPAPTEGLQKPVVVAGFLETCGQPQWHGQETVPQQARSLFPNALTRKQVWFVAGLIGVLWLIQLPRGIIASIPYDPAAKQIITPEEQQAVFRHIEEVDRRCAEHAVSAETARRVLPPLAVPRAPGEFNGWDYLRGSATPRTPETRSDETIRQLLLE